MNDDRKRAVIREFDRLAEFAEANGNTKDAQNLRHRANEYEKELLGESA